MYYSDCFIIMSFSTIRMDLGGIGNVCVHGCTCTVCMYVLYMYI